MQRLGLVFGGFAALLVLVGAWLSGSEPTKEDEERATVGRQPPRDTRPADPKGDESDAPADRDARHRLPREFRPLDTRRLVGSPNPFGYEPVPAFPNLEFKRPVELTFAPDGTNLVYVVEQQGRIHVFPNRPNIERTEVFLDIEEIVSREGNEEGLLGLAFHPRFRENGEFYVYYSTKPRGSHLSRFRVRRDDPLRADRDSEEVILRIEQPYANHNGGSIRFGPDGYLYIGLGDGGAADDPHLHAQNLETLLGSILRIDVDRRDEGREYAIPRDNPFAGRADARGEIWAYGLRNVWRMAFDRETGELWAADVGQDRIEEVNLIRRGGNYGWNIREGFQPFEPVSTAKHTNLIDPVVEYTRGDGESVTGGQVYRGRRLPGLVGAYIYADYVSGNIWGVRPGPDGTANNPLLARTRLEIAAFGEDREGEIYLCAFDGRIYTLQPRELDLERLAEQFPRRLSETGLYRSVADNEPAEGMIPYELNMPFWSDYTVKDRYLVLPRGESVEFDEKAKWKFPFGTVFVKTFWMHRDRVNLAKPVRLETRLLINGHDGWFGVTYLYDDEQREAYLLDGSLQRPITIETEHGKIDQPYYFPSRRDCFECHTRSEGFVLGLTTRQMNRPLYYRGEKENQIALLDRLGVFTDRVEQDPDELPRFPDWRFGNWDRSPDDEREESSLDSPEGDATELARAWLEVNCAVCHRPDGIAPHRRDLRHEISLEEMRLVEQPPKQGQLGPPGVRLITPGNPLASELFLRMNRRGTRQMPPVASKVVDPRGSEVVRKWIEDLKPQPELATEPKKERGAASLDERLSPKGDLRERVLGKE